MAHREQLKFISLLEELFIRERKPDLRILEVGSYDVNGSIRQFFGGCDYVGADLTPGPGVDLVCSGHEIDLPDESFHLTISCECFEHNVDWVATLNNMYRMTRAGGMVVVTCASRGRIEHGTARTNARLSPGTTAVGIDYYKNLTKRDFTKAFDLKHMFDTFRMFYVPTNHDLYFVGWKHGAGVPDGLEAGLKTFEKQVEQIKHMQVRDQLPLVHKAMLSVQASFITLASYVLDDATFQNARFRYLERAAPLKGRIKRMLRLSTDSSLRVSTGESRK